MARAPHVHEDCRAVSGVLARVGDKWSVLVIVRMGGGPRRFSELRREVNGISQRMLTLTLRGLERDGLVARTQYPTVPPRVDYELTRLGRSLLAAVTPLGEWAQAHVPHIARAQAAFDAAHEEDAPRAPEARMPSARR